MKNNFKLMRLASLFSGGKDSVYATYLAKKFGHEISCLVSIISKNKNSYMFHTPSIDKTRKQAEVMNLPLIVWKSKGEKEKELTDLKEAILKAKKEYKIEGIVTGAIKSVYQASRVQKICDELGLECFNPLWQKDESKYLGELIGENFKIVLVGVFAYPLDDSWLLREIDSKFVKDILKLERRYKINVAGEGGEFESFVLDCPLFEKKLRITNKEIKKEGENSFRVEVEIK